jgi:phosphoadenosine phosphosulfate reductase
MGQVLTLELDTGAASGKAADVRQFLIDSLQRYPRIVYASSLGAEAMVLTDIICTEVPEIDVVTIDTGRLHEETQELLERLQRRYVNRIRIIYPDAEELGNVVGRQGTNGFFHSPEARVACCEVRKVLPFKRFVAGYSAWITGVRREQSRARALGAPVEWDAHNRLFKLSPLLDWTSAEVWSYIHAHGLPYNPLHDRNYPSIGCAPCTRAVQPGEDHRAGRWWWENTESRECGLHPRVRSTAARSTAPRAEAPRTL